MTHPAVDATSLFQEAEQAGISLEWLAAMTNVSWHAVYAYKTGRRRTPPAWLEKAQLLVTARANLPSPRDGV